MRRRTFIAAVLATTGVIGVGALAQSLAPRNVSHGQIAGSSERDLAAPDVHLTIDASRVIGRLDRSLWANIGFDPFYSGTTAPENKRAWELISETKPLRYIRCHNMFSDAAPSQPENRVYGCRIYTEDKNGNPSYSWTYLDQVLDIWRAAGLRPILEVDFMPDTLADGTIVRNYSGGAINTPKDYEKWGSLICETVKHCEQRCGADEVRTWYWEIWNEPDLRTYFIDGIDPSIREPFTPQKVARLCRMYDYFVDGATSADPQIRVGGPGIAGNENYFRGFLAHCVDGKNEADGATGARIDFISWHAYGTINSTLSKNRSMRKIIESEFPSLAGKELQQNEWGQPLQIGVPSSDRVFTEYEAAFLCRYVDAMISDPTARVHKFLRWGQPAGNPLTHTGWRPLTTMIGSITYRNAILNAYDMLAKLGEELVEVTGAHYGDLVHAIATRVGIGSFRVLVYSFDESNDEQSSSRRVQVDFRGLNSSQSPKISHYRIDSDHSNPYAVWLRANKPGQPQQELADDLKEQSHLQTVDLTQILIRENLLSATFELPVSACSLLSVEANQVTR